MQDRAIVTIERYYEVVQAVELRERIFIYLFNVHRYNTRENNITKSNSMPLTGDKSTMVASMQVTLQYQTNKNY